MTEQVKRKAGSFMELFATNTVSILGTVVFAYFAFADSRTQTESDNLDMLITGLSESVIMLEDRLSASIEREEMLRQKIRTLEIIDKCELKKK